MEQHLGRQAGVQKVHVSLIDGTVEITPKSDNQIEPIQLLKATYDSGVSVAEMTIVAQGKVIKTSGDTITFEVQPGQIFPITQNNFAQQLETLAGSDSPVTIRGLLYQKQKGQKKQTLPTFLKLTVIEILQNE